MYVYHWSDETIEHLAEHDVTPEEFEAIVDDPEIVTTSQSSGLPAARGWIAGRELFCVYRMLTDIDVEPVTAYEVGY